MDSDDSQTMEIEELQCEVPNLSKKRSQVYTHFTYSEKTKKFRCNYCPGNYAKEPNCGTGNLMKHLKIKHANKIQQSSNLPASTVTDSLIMASFRKAQFSNEEFHRLLVEFIILTDQPFSIVEAESFLDLFGYFANSSAKIPKRDSIKNKIVSMYANEKENAKKALGKSLGKISLIVDCWSTKNGKCFHGIMATYVDENFQYRQLVLDFDILHGSHTGVKLAESILRTLDDYNISDKLLAITCDNASNMDKMCDELENKLKQKDLVFNPKDQRIRCFAHIVNLACQAALSVIKKIGPRADLSICETSDDSSDDEKLPASKQPLIYERIKSAVRKIRKSNVLSDSLRHFCESMNIDEKSLLNDMPVRWNSTYKMLKRCVLLRQALDATMRSDKVLSVIVLSDSEWNVVDKIVKFLEPFNRLTEKMSQQFVPNMCLTAAFYMDIYDHLESYKRNGGHHKSILEAAKLACDKLNKYYPESDGLAYIMGVVLNPRCKLEWHRLVGFKDLIPNYRKVIGNHWNKFYKPKNVENNSEIPGDDIFARQMKKSKINIQDQLEKYLLEPTCAAKDMTGGVLNWWKDRVHVYPDLSKMAFDFLGVSATSVPMECLFSMGTDLLTPKRLSMVETTIRMCMCLKGWLKFKRQGSSQFLSNAIVKKIEGDIDG